MRLIGLAVALAFSVFVAPLLFELAAGEAQQTGKIPRIGFLVAGTPSAVSARVEAFRQGLRERGYVEGKNIVVEYRYGEDTFPVRSGDLVGASAGVKAHQLINTGATDLRYLGISSGTSVDLVDYPDSKKIAVAAGVKNADFKTATYVGMGRITPADYYDGEDV